MRRLVFRIGLASPSTHVRPEWPPSPSRLSGALAASGFRSGMPEEDIGRPMRVLETLPAPSILAPGRLGEARDVRIAVPHNQAELAMAKLAQSGRGALLDGLMAQHKDLRPWRETLLDGTDFAYAYPVPVAALDEVSGNMAGFRLLARALHAFGRAMDVACCSVDLEGTLSPDATAWWRPDETGGTTLRLPVRGAFAEMVENHPVREDVDDGGVRFAKPASRWRETAYVPPGTPVLAPACAFALRPVEGRDDFVAFDGRDRTAVASAIAGIPLPEGVSVVPLPSVGGDHADGRLRRLLAVAPTHEAMDEVRYLLSHRVVEVAAGDDVVEVLLEEAGPGTPVVKHYVAGGVVATTVVPALLRVEGEATDAALSAVVSGLSPDVRGLVEECEVRREPYEAWGAKVSGGRDAAGFLRRHVRLRFSSRVAGPLSVGEGTDRGYGLTRFREPVKTRRFRISGPGRPTAADAVRVTDAFRKAVLSKAGALGLRPSPALTGRAMDGSPIRSEGPGLHGHAYWMVETDDMPGAARGRVDAIVVHAEAGMSSDDVQALEGVSRLWTGEVPSCPDGGWFVAAEPDEPSPLVGYGREWRSITPYLVPRNARYPAKAREDLRRLVAGRYGIPVEAVEVDEERVDGRPLGRRMLDCDRGRKQETPDKVGVYYRIVLPTAVRGPFVGGALAHWGMGHFAPLGKLDART